MTLMVQEIITGFFLNNYYYILSRPISYNAKINVTASDLQGALILLTKSVRRFELMARVGIHILGRKRWECQNWLFFWTSIYANRWWPHVNVIFWWNNTHHWRFSQFVNATFKKKHKNIHMQNEYTIQVFQICENSMKCT